MNKGENSMKLSENGKNRLQNEKADILAKEDFQNKEISWKEELSHPWIFSKN